MLVCDGLPLEPGLLSNLRQPCPSLMMELQFWDTMQCGGGGGFLKKRILVRISLNFRAILKASVYMILSNEELNF